jgi:uncharacterized membrane protein
MAPTGTASAAPSAAPSERGGVTPEERNLEEIDFIAKKSMRYHSRLRASLERLDNWSNWLIAVVGASAFAALVGSDTSKLAKVLTFAVAAIGLADVIFSFGSRARVHQDLYRTSLSG